MIALDPMIQTAARMPISSPRCNALPVQRLRSAWRARRTKGCHHDRSVMIAPEPAVHTAGRAPISPGQRAEPTSPSRLVAARLEPNAARLTFRQPLAAISRFGWSMRSWDSVRDAEHRRRALPRSHGPSEERFAAQRLTFGQCLGARHPIAASPRGWRSTRAGGRATGRACGNASGDDPGLRNASGLVTGPICLLAACTGSGGTP